jgi:hypothetical protein
VVVEVAEADAEGV